MINGFGGCVSFVQNFVFVVSSLRPTFPSEVTSLFNVPERDLVDTLIEILVGTLFYSSRMLHGTIVMEGALKFWQD